MAKKFIKISYEIHCDWEGFPPDYRLYVNDELFTERTFKWTNKYVKEILQISAEPGEYQVSLVELGFNYNQFEISNPTVLHGDVQLATDGKFRILSDAI